MGIDVQVIEFSGAVVARLDVEVDVNRLCAAAAEDPARYPLLSGVDEYDDTYFNSRQSARLAQELESITADDSGVDLRPTAEAIMELAGLLRPAPGRPHHRRLVFVGD